MLSIPTPAWTARSRNGVKARRTETKEDGINGTIKVQSFQLEHDFGSGETFVCHTKGTMRHARQANILASRYM